MPITLDIDILQKHRVCRDGQVQFRRKFGRTHTWQTLAQMTSDFAAHHSCWNWDEAADKFLGESETWEALRDKLQDEYDSRDDGEEDDSEEELFPRDRLPCVAWCQLYWAKMNDTSVAMSSRVPAAAKAYLEAVQALEETKKFKATVNARSRLSSLDIDGYHKGNEKHVLAFIKRRLDGQLPALVDETIKHYEFEISRLKEELHAVLTAETIPVEVTPAAAAAPMETGNDESQTGADNEAGHSSVLEIVRERTGDTQQRRKVRTGG